jgi:DNA polymerase III delta prime subunit
MLTPTCANSLLKSIEEPPPGYYFILHAQAFDRVIPTIRSRCLVTRVQGHNASPDHPLLACFTAQKPPSASVFIKIVEASKITEQETANLLEHLLQRLLAESRQTYVTDTSNAILEHRLATIKMLCSRPTMPGSSKIIWRELFLQWNR